MRIFFTLFITFFLIGCAARQQTDANASTVRSDHDKVTYYDRNHDGRVDYELHDFGCCDRNWALVDTDFNGRYDMKFKWGYVFTREPTDTLVVTNVSISPKNPPDPQQ